MSIDTDEYPIPILLADYLSASGSKETKTLFKNPLKKRINRYVVPETKIKENKPFEKLVVSDINCQDTNGDNIVSSDIVSSEIVSSDIVSPDIVSSDIVTPGPDIAAQDVLSRLRFISRIQPGEKIEVESLRVHIHSWGNNLKRWWQSEGREYSLEFVRRAIVDAIIIIEDFLYHSDKLYRQVGELVLATLKDSRAGLYAFARTYESDRMYVARVETLRDMVTLRVTAIEKKYSIKVVKIE
jgi:hypothetical protein